MGVLQQNAGVLGGIGQAISQLGADKRAERLAALQYDREIAIRRMENEHQSSENKLTRDQTASEGAKNRQVDVGKLGLERDKLDADVSEGAKNRASNEKIAGVRAAATRDAAGARGANKKRWTVNKTANTDIKKGTTTEDIVLTDNNSGRTYKQLGGMFVPQGTAGTPRQAARSEIAKLVSNPGAADQFLKTYGYLPLEAFGNNQSTAAGADETDPDEE